MATPIRISTLPNPPSPEDLDELDAGGLRICDYLIELDPTRALYNIEGTFAAWWNERKSDPGALVLGVETYWSLAHHESGGRFPLVHPTSCRGVPILIDDEIRWRVKLVASLERAEHWRCAVDEKS